MSKSIKSAAAIFLTAAFAFNMSAQDTSIFENCGVIGIHKANDPSGKILTMEETILSFELSPKYESYVWTADGKGYKAVKRKDLPGKESEDRYTVSLKDNGIYLIGRNGETVTVAEPENENISYGQIVSRNEFGIDKGIFWSNSKDRIAFYRKDESAVTRFPLLDINSRTGTLRQLVYPMAGMPSEILRLCVYDIEKKDTVHIKVDDFGADRYLTNISWSPDDRHIFIQVLDRSQKHLKLNMYDAATGELVRTLLTEDNEKYVEPLDPVHFIKGSTDRFIYRTNNRDGYRNLYICDLSGNVKRLTEVDADVEYLDNDGKYVYCTSSAVSPIENHLYKVSIRNGKVTRLTEASGWHNISLSPDCTMFIDRFSSLNTPGVISLCSTDGRFIRTLHTAEDPTIDYAYSEILLGKIRSADGRFDNYYRMVLPKDFDPSKKYPAIVYVYGGPHSQMVRNTWLGELRRWEMYMAQKGYVVYVQDNRGTSNQGIEFEQAIHGQCGQAEMADQIEGAKMLMSLPFVDKDRIGVHGWSYGGFMTISLITNYPDIFKVAVAGGPVIDWKWYEVMYGERYMDSPLTNAEGYEKVSLINKAKDLKGKLLICQGSVDPVVVWQHSLSFVQECIRNNVQVDYFPYPVAEHNMAGKERVHLHDKITAYFEDYLK